jgi:hypothetical protein
MNEQTPASLENMRKDRKRNAVSGADREALSRSAEDVRQRRFATATEVKAVFDRYRRR